MTQSGLALVKSFEGCKLVAYRDIVGVWTIGYGHTKTAHPGLVWTQAQADTALLEELNDFETGVREACTLAPTPEQASAMTALAYNIGINGFKTSSVLRRHNAGDRAGAASAFGMWNKAGGKVVPGLVRRRAAEASLYLS